MKKQQQTIEKSTMAGSEIKQQWMDYCNDSTIDGLHYAGGTGYKPKHVRITFAVCLIICQILVTYQCYTFVLDYYDYNVLTTITYDNVTSLPFPAITFCNVYPIKKSYAGINNDTLMVLSFIASKTKEQQPVIYEQSKKPCLIAEMDSFSKLKVALKIMLLIKNADPNAIMKEFGIDSFLSVKKCWWNNQEINCGNIFANHFFENKLCFTFNQDSSDIDIGDVVASYGLSKADKVTRNVSNTGQAGFRVLLNTRQDEYCIAPPVPYGAGFRIAIHNVQSLPSSELVSYILLSPGFEHNIILQPQLFDSRNFSESRGKCTSNAFSFLTPNSKVYNQEKCITACMIEKVFRSCNCLLVPNNSTLISKQTAKILHVGNVRNCLFDLSKGTNGGSVKWDFGCIQDATFEFESLPLNITCPNCKKKCLDTVYDYQISSRKFSNSIINSLRSPLYNSSESVRKNFIIANFKFDDIQLMSVRELQLVPPLDLFINIANSIGLFLGLSTLTPYEIIHEIAISIVTIIFKRIKKKSKKKIFKKKIRVFFILPTLFTRKSNNVTKVTKIKNTTTREGENNTSTLLTKKQMRK